MTSSLALVCTHPTPLLRWLSRGQSPFWVGQYVPLLKIADAFYTPSRWSGSRARILVPPPGTDSI